MAKQLVNPIERHVEKGVVAVAALVLLGSVGRFLVTSPNQIELGGEFVTPGTIDQKVKLMADGVRERIRGAAIQVDVPDPLRGEFEASLDPFVRDGVATTLPLVAPLGPEVPLIDTAGTVEGQRSLVEVAPLGAPKVILGRSTFLFHSAAGEDLDRPGNWITVSVLFDVKQQMALQRREWGVTEKQVIFGAVELQRRKRRDDGAWSKDDWRDVDTWPATELPAAPEIPLMQRDGRVMVRPDALAAIERFFDRISDTLLQMELLRPLTHEMVNGDSWGVPIITSLKDVLMQDDEYFFPNDPPAANPANRYSTGEERQQVVVVNLTPAERIAKLFDEFEALMKSAKANSDRDEAVRAYNKAFEISRDTSATASQKTRAQRLMVAADQRAKEIDFAKRRGQQGPLQGVEDGNKPKRQPRPTQQFWAHDARPGAVESGAIYQYRIRVNVYNRLAGRPEKFLEPTDAAELFVPSPWSEPAEVSVPADTLYFFTTKDERNKEVGVEFFKWESGVWVKSRRFKYAVGEAIEGQSRAQIPSLEDPTVAFNAPVTFEAHGTVLDIDFERSYRDRKRARTRGGVKFGAPSKACCVVFADASGRLHERYLLTEKGNPDKRQAQDREWKPPRKE